MPTLLADLWALGTDPAQVARLLQPLLPANARVLDLACGKGAVSVTLAARLGCYMDGIDGMPAFIDTARVMAAKHGVAHRCRFDVGDIRAYQSDGDLYDAVILGAVGPIFGGLQENVGRLRRMVKPGGYLILDDAWRMDRSHPLPDRLATCPLREQARAALIAHGDVIVAEEEIPVSRLQNENTRNNLHIQRRVDDLTRQHPDRAALFCAYASCQLFECYLLENVYRCCVWMLRTRQA